MEANFNPQEFYSRQRILSELGAKGQEKLRDSKVTVIGLGGLGSVSALYLALAGVGTLTLVDLDTVELNNLHRQVLYSMSDLRYPKVEAAQRRIKQINPEVSVNAIPENLTAENVDSILAGADCVVDGLDNMQTRYLINRQCVEKRMPLVFGGAIGLEGNVAVFKSPETPCLECILPGLDDTSLPTCDTRGVLGATTGIVGAIQAMEAVKVLAGIEPESKGKLMVFDFAQSEFRTINLKVRPDCNVCQIKKAILPQYPTKLAWLCGSNTANVNPEKPQTLDLRALSESIDRKHRVLLTTPMVLVFDYEGHEVSLFSKGRMLIKNVSNEDQALQVYHGILNVLSKRLDQD
ncbi:MAG TPA: HesA/MoeB/ThiF family protein [Candidatus Acidoferrales bacterium]|nr:HesA/MoeB/ThiF family protein [Candidatus Acidoferrales bacterium]